MEDKLRTLYDNLVKDNYDLPEFDMFKSDMGDPQKSKSLYDNLVKDNYDLPDYDTFTVDLGVKKKDLSFLDAITSASGKEDIPFLGQSGRRLDYSGEPSTAQPPLQSEKKRETTPAGDVLRALKSGSQRALGGITGTPQFLNRTIASFTTRPIIKAMGGTDEDANIYADAIMASSPLGQAALGGGKAQERLNQMAAKTEAKMQPIEGNIIENFKQGNFEQAGELLARGVFQSAPYLAMTMATAGGGTAAVLGTIGATAASQQYAELEGKPESKRVLNAWMYGGFEGLGELVTAGLATGIKTAFKQAITQEAKESLIKGASKALAKSFLGEASSEAATQIGQNLTDIVTDVDPNRKIFDNVMDAALIGGVSGAGLGGAQIGASAIGRAMASDKEVKQVQDNVQQQAVLIDQIEQTDSDPMKEALKRTVKNLKIKADEVMDANAELATKLSPEQQNEVAGLYSTWNELQDKVDSGEITDAEKPAIENTIKGIKDEIQSIKEELITKLEEEQTNARGEETPAPQEVSIGERTPATKGQRRILGITSDEAFSTPITMGGTEIGSATIENVPEGWRIKWIDTEGARVNKEARGSGREAMRVLNTEAQKEGKVLISDIAGKNSTNMIRAWDKLVESGEAEKLGEESYRFKGAEEVVSPQEPTPLVSDTKVESLTIADLKNKPTAELDNLITQLEEGMRDLIASGDEARVTKANELIGAIIDIRNERQAAESPKVESLPQEKTVEQKVNDRIVDLVKTYNSTPASYSKQRSLLMRQINGYVARLGYSLKMNGRELVALNKKGKRVQRIKTRGGNRTLQNYKSEPEKLDFMLTILNAPVNLNGLDIPVYGKKLPKAVKDVLDERDNQDADMLLRSLSDMFDDGYLKFRGDQYDVAINIKDLVETIKSDNFNEFIKANGGFNPQTIDKAADYGLIDANELELYKQYFEDEAKQRIEEESDFDRYQTEPYRGGIEVSEGDGIRAKEPTKAEQLKTKEEEVKAKIAQNLDDLMGAIGGIAQLTGDERAKVLNTLVDLVKNLAELTGLKGQQLYEEVKKRLSERGVTVPDDVLAEAMGEEMPEIAPKETPTATISDETGKEPPAPPSEPTEAINEPKEPDELEKSLLTRLKNASKLSDKFREQVDRKGLTYTAIPNDVTSEEVDFLIASNGIDKSDAMVRDTKNNMPARVRGLMGIRLISALDALADEAAKANNPKTEYEYRQRSISMAEFLDETARDWGRGIQIFASTEVNAALSPKSQVIRAKKAIRKQRDAQIQDSKKDINKKSKDLNKANEESVEEALQTKLVTEAKKKVVRKNDGVIVPRKKVAADKLKEEAKFRKDKFAEFKQAWEAKKKAEKGGAMGLSANAFEETLVRIAGEIFRSYLKSGLYNVEAIIAKAQKDFKKIADIDIDAETLRGYFPKDIDGKPVEEVLDENESEATAAKLAGRVTAMLKDPQVAKDDPIKQMVNTLFEKVAEKDTKEKVPVDKKTDLQKITDAIKNINDYISVWEQAKEIVKQNIESNDELSEEQKAEYTERLQAFYDEVIGQPFSNKQAERATKKGLKDMEVNIDKVVRDHYTVYDATKRSLQEKLVEEAGLENEDAKMLADAIGKEFDKIAIKKKRALLEKGIKPKEIAAPKKAKQVWEKLIELTNMGAFSDAEFAEAYADAWGFPQLSTEQIKEIERLAKKVYDAPEGEKKFEAVQDLLAYQANVQGIDLGDVAMGMWYSSILSGFRTQFKNIFANTLNTLFELTTIAAKDPRNIPMAINGLFNGWVKGGYAFAHVLQSGYTPIRGYKIEVPSALEQYSFKGGAWNPANWFKYVPRFMVAADAFSYGGLKEMRAYEMAMNEAREENKKNETPTMSTQAKANEILYHTKQRIAEAEAQATQEGFKQGGTRKERNEFKRRVWEIMEQSRGQKIIEDSAHFAAHGTFNYPPEGLIGFATEMIGEMTQGISGKFTVAGKSFTVRPLKFIIPFTRIIANVANTALDYFPPTGIARGLSGGIGSKSLDETRFGKGTYRQYSEEERKTVYRKALIGLGATTALFMLSAPSDDDEESTIEITANGYGDYQKNYELQERGWQKYSIRIGNKWFSYQYTPLVLALAPIGFFRDEQKYNKGRFDEKDMAVNLGLSYFKSFSVLGDMTWVTQLTGLLDAMKGSTLSEVEGYFSRMGQSTAKGIIYPKLAEQTVQMIDYMSENPRKAASTLGGKIMKDIPIVRNKYNVMLNAVGEPVMYDPFQMISEVKTDPFWDYVAKHNINIGKPSQKDTFYDDVTKTERTMTDQEYFDFIKTTGPEIKRRIVEELMTSTMTDEEIKQEVSNIKSEVRKKAKTEMFGWGDYRVENPQEWSKLIDAGAIQTPASTIPDMVVNKEVMTFDKDDVAEYNRIAMERYSKRVLSYINSGVSAKDRGRDVVTANGIISKYDQRIDEFWSDARARAKEQVVRNKKKASSQ